MTDTPWRESWARDLDLSQVRAGRKVRHNNPELTDWTGTIVPLTRGPRKGQCVEHINTNEGADAFVRVSWQTGGDPKPGWYGATAIRLEDD